MIPKENMITRIWYQNVNGISAKDDMSDASWIAQFAEDHDIDIMALSETNISWNNPNVKRHFMSRIKQVWPIVNILTAASTELRDTTYQPGGVSLILQGGWSGHTTNNHSDPLGRWATTTLQGRDGRTVALITAYRVCQQTVSPERDQTAFMQQWRALRSQGHDDPKPRQQCLQDLKAFIQGFRDQHTPVILMWDANEPTTTTNMQQFLVDTALVDIFEAAYGSEELPATCRRGTQKIDHFMVSPELLPYIQRHGIETTGYGIQSDHRALYCDIELGRWLRGNAAHIEAPTRRGLQSRDPTATETYLQAVNEYLQGHRFYQRLSEVLHGPADALDTARALEALDSDMTQARKAAEKKVKRRHKSQWSPELHQAKSKLQYWKLRLSEFKNPGIKVSKGLRYLFRESGQQSVDTTVTTEREYRQRIRSAAKEYQTLLANHDKLCDQYLLQRANALATAQQLDTAKVIKRLRHIEHMAAQFGRIRQAYSDKTKGGLRHVLRPRPGTTRATEFEAVYDLEEVEQLLLRRNINHFGQANGTPPTESATQQLLGLGLSHFSDQVLQGTADLHQIRHEGMRRWLQQITGKALPEFNAYVTPDDLRSGFKAWREATSTSPSGLHLGHYRCSLGQFDKPSQDDETASTAQDSSISDQLLEAHAGLINCAIKHGHVFTRWKTVHNCMLEKNPGKTIATQAPSHPSV